MGGRDPIQFFLSESRMSGYHCLPDFPTPRDFPCPSVTLSQVKFSHKLDCFWSFPFYSIGLPCLRQYQFCTVLVTTVSLIPMLIGKSFTIFSSRCVVPLLVLCFFMYFWDQCVTHREHVLSILSALHESY